MIPISASWSQLAQFNKLMKRMYGCLFQLKSFSSYFMILQQFFSRFQKISLFSLKHKNIFTFIVKLTYQIRRNSEEENNNYNRFKKGNILPLHYHLHRIKVAKLYILLAFIISKSPLPPYDNYNNNYSIIPVITIIII